MLKPFITTDEYDALHEQVRQHYRPIEFGAVLEIEQQFSPTIGELVAEAFEKAERGATC